MKGYYRGCCCGMCGAGKAHLHAYEHVLLDGTRLQEVRCMLCGWSRSRTVLVRTMAREVEPTSQVMKERGAIGAAASIAVARMNASAKREWVPCLMDGCDNLRIAYSKSGLCKACAKPLTRYRRGLIKSAQPILQREDGTWFKNPDYIPWSRGRGFAIRDEAVL